MELKLMKKRKQSIEFELVDADKTILYPLVEELVNDKKVEIARYIVGHPQLDKPKIFVKVKDGKPQTAVKRVAKKLAKQFKECNEALEK